MIEYHKIGLFDGEDHSIGLRDGENLNNWWAGENNRYGPLSARRKVLLLDFGFQRISDCLEPWLR